MREVARPVASAATSTVPVSPAIAITPPPMRSPHGSATPRPICSATVCTRSGRITNCGVVARTMRPRTTTSVGVKKPRPSETRPRSAPPKGIGSPRPMSVAALGSAENGAPSRRSQNAVPARPTVSDAVRIRDSPAGLP